MCCSTYGAWSTEDQSLKSCETVEIQWILWNPVKSMKSCEIWDFEIHTVFWTVSDPSFFCVMVYHLLEVVFISVGGSVSMFHDDYSYRWLLLCGSREGGRNLLRHIVVCLWFHAASYDFTLSLCVCWWYRISSNFLSGQGSEKKRTGIVLCPSWTACKQRQKTINWRHNNQLCMISLGLAFFGFGTKDSPILRTSFSAVESLLLLRLTIVSVVLGCWVRWYLALWRARALEKSWPIDMTNWKPLDLLYASGLIAGIYISSDWACRMSSQSVLFSLVSPSPNAKWSFWSLAIDLLLQVYS